MIKKRIIEAYNWAEKHHSGVTRKFSGLPYFTHVKFVARTLENLGCDEDLIVAGFLHDLIEDTDVTYEMIEQKFGKRVADIVLGVSSVKEDMVAAGGKRLYLAKKICEMDEDQLTLKLADRFHNVLFLEHDATPESFIIKYFKETRFILFSLEEDGRKLNEIQVALVARIQAILEFLRIRYSLI